MSKRTLTLLVATAALLTALPACTFGSDGSQESDGETIASQQSAVTYFQVSMKVTGFLVSVQGIGLNGRDLNGSLLDGSHVTHVPLASAFHDGSPMSDVSLEASKLAGRTAKGKRLLLRQFKDVRFTAFTDTGETVNLWIKGARRWMDPGMKDTFLYDVQYETLEGWEPLCGTDDAGVPVEAIALNGHWDYREGVAGGGSKIDDPATFTFACRGHVAAKCLEMGYKPWRTGLVCEVGQGCQRESLGHLHQACTRALRADYCGDGIAHTEGGMLISVYDGYGIRLDSEDWEIESEWTPDGALCLGRARLGDMSDLPCLASLTQPACGDASHFVDGTALISEVPPQ